jgi:hypothetical protein
VKIGFAGLVADCVIEAELDSNDCPPRPKTSEEGKGNGLLHIFSEFSAEFHHKLACGVPF